MFLFAFLLVATIAISSSDDIEWNVGHPRDHMFNEDFGEEGY